MKNTMHKLAWSMGLVVCCGLVATQMNPAFAAQPDLPSFGIIGMAPGSEFLRLNVTNLNVPGLSFVGPSGMTLVGPCTAELSFSDGQGNAYKRVTANLALQQSTHLDLMGSDLPASAIPPLRVEILPSLARDGNCTLVSSVEVIHTVTGQTDGYAIRKDNSGNGIIPIYGLIGMAPASQFIRFNVSNQAIPGISTGTCEVELSFTDGGTTTLKSMEVPLALGTSAHLDLMASDLATSSAPIVRIEVLPSLTYAGRCALNSTVEVITIATGQTSASAAQSVLQGMQPSTLQ